MGWGRFLLLGNLGQQLDIQDRQREIDTLRGQMNGQWSRDQDQDMRIETLHHETRELKLCIASLVKLLAAKQVVSPVEVQDLVRTLDDSSG